MSKIIYKKESKHSTHIPIHESEMKYTGLDVYKLEKGESFETCVNEGRELCIVILSGYVDCTLIDKEYLNLGNRETVFEDTVGYAIYVSQKDYFKLTAITEVEIAVCEGVGYGTYPSRILYPNESLIEHRGNGVMQRTAKNILPESFEADSLLIVEVITRGGNWSSFPSHRHDEDDLPNQSYLEEIYYHKISTGSAGFAFQRIYNDDETISDSYTIKDGCSVLVWEGYHPVSVPPGNDLYYLNVMAGPTRTWKFYNDPNYESLLDK